MELSLELCENKTEQLLGHSYLDPFDMLARLLQLRRVKLNEPPLSWQFLSCFLFMGTIFWR